VDVVEKKFLCPGNLWPDDERLKKIGQFTMTNTYEGFVASGERYSRLSACRLKRSKNSSPTPSEMSQTASTVFSAWCQSYIYLIGAPTTHADKLPATYLGSLRTKAL
jgi:hypothetical protein